MKQRPDPRIMLSLRVVALQVVLRTQGRYISVKGLRAAVVQGQPNAFLCAYSTAGATCAASVPAAPLHRFTQGKPSPARQSHALAGWSATRCCRSAR